MVIIIGGGPAGLAAAAALKAEGVPAQVLDRAAEVGASWKAHYDRLHLHTVRWLSGLPGLPIPKAYGKWVSRDDVVRYLKKYAAHHQLQNANYPKLVGRIAHISLIPHAPGVCDHR